MIKINFIIFSFWISSVFQPVWAGDPISGSWQGRILGDQVELAVWPHPDKKSSSWHLWNGLLHSPKHNCYMVVFINISKQNDKKTHISLTSNSSQVRSKNNCSTNIVTKRNIKDPSILREFSIIHSRRKAMNFVGSEGKFQLNKDSSVLNLQFQQFQFKGLNQKNRYSYVISLRRSQASTAMLSYLAGLKPGSSFVKPGAEDIAYLKTKERTRADLYTAGKDFDKDAQTFNDDLALAQNGDKEAQFRVGYWYEHGIGAKKDDSKALHWYLKAAENGQLSAMFYLAGFYQGGRGGSKSNWDKALYWYSLSAERGVKESQYNMAFFYHRGRLGVEKNYDKALHWYLKAAENGMPIASNNIGVMFKNGDGLPSDPWLAYLWYRHAAKNGDKTASNNLRAMEAKIPYQQANEVKQASNKISFSKLKELTLLSKQSGEKSANLALFKEKRPGYFDRFGDCGSMSCDEQFTNDILINYYY